MNKYLLKITTLVLAGLFATLQADPLVESELNPGYTEFNAIADIFNLNKLNTNQDAVQMARREMRDGIVQYVKANVDNLIDNRFAKDKEQLIKELPSLDELQNMSESMTISKLSKDKLLINIQTYLAAYQATGLFMIYDMKTIKLAIVPFQNTSTKSYDFVNILNYEIIDNDFIQITSKARGVGDCGNISIYQYQEGAFNLVNQREFACT